MVDLKVDNFGRPFAPLLKKIVDIVSSCVERRVAYSEIAEKFCVFSIRPYSDLRVANYQIKLIIKGCFFTSFQIIALIIG